MGNVLMLLKEKYQAKLKCRYCSEITRSGHRSEPQ